MVTKKKAKARTKKRVARNVRKKKAKRERVNPRPPAKSTHKEQDDWPAAAVEMRSVSDLIPYANNARTHSGAQIKKIAASIREWGWTNPVLIDEEGGILAGHGRVLAAELLKIEEVPVMLARGWSVAQKRAYVLADNRLALDAGWDLELLNVEFTELAALNFDLPLTGFALGEIGTYVKGHRRHETPYAVKIESPVYQATGDQPEVADLYDDRKADELRTKIDEAEDIPDDVRDFLHAAAGRHVSFHYERIAEFYCHASPGLQRLMEESALVIIDFNQAIEHGFVRVCDRLRDIAGEAMDQEEAELGA